MDRDGSIFSLAGQVAVVTGAGRGIGAAIAKALAAAGANLVITSRTASELNGVEEELRPIGVEAHKVIADLSDPAQVQPLFDQAIERFSKVDILVNNAGIVRVRRFLEHDLAAWDDVFAINTRAAFLCSQAAARLMAAAGRGGRIIMISSHYATEAHEGSVAYCASKAALEAISRNLALELAPHRITVNSVRVGSVPTSLLSEEQSRRARAEIWRELEAAGVNRAMPPIGRRGTPDDIGSVVRFLASPAAGWVTGATIYADGGTHLRMMLC